MYRIILIGISLIASSISMELVFGAGCDIDAELPTTSELTGKVQQCILARAGMGETPNSITDFVCPQGEMFVANNQTINNETLAYLTSVSLSFNKIDLDIKKYMQQLQKNRTPDPTIWINTMNLCRENMSRIYANICIFGNIESQLNQDAKKYINTTLAYPQTLCIDLASKKVRGWHYFQTILMADGISKNQKNSTDVWVTEVKGAYGRVHGKLLTYKTILERAVSKMNFFIKESN